MKSSFYKFSKSVNWFGRESRKFYNAADRDSSLENITGFVGKFSKCDRPRFESRKYNCGLVGQSLK